MMRTIQQSKSESHDILLSTALRLLSESSIDQGFPELISCESQRFSDKFCALNLDEMDFDDLPIIYKVAGYVGRTVARRRRCLACSDLLLSSETDPLSTTAATSKPNVTEDTLDFFDSVNRGGLHHPRECLLTISSIAYYYMELIERDNEIYRSFSCCRFQRDVFVNIIISKIHSSPLACFCDLSCEQQYNVTPNILFCLYITVLLNLL